MPFHMNCAASIEYSRMSWPPVSSGGKKTSYSCKRSCHSCGRQGSSGICREQFNPSIMEAAKAYVGFLVAVCREVSSQIVVAWGFSDNHLKRAPSIRALATLRC